MKSIVKSLLCVGLFAWNVQMQAKVNIIPKPSQVEELSGCFLLKNGMSIGISDESLAPAATYLQELLSKSTGFSIKTGGKAGKIQLNLVSPDEADESYILETGKKGVVISAHSYRGIINGIATLRQLLPPEIE